MSPSRTRKPVAHLRSRSEIVVAVLVGVAIVLITAFLVWAMRPGKVGSSGTGGILSRQPRVTLFVVLVGVVLAVAITWMLRGRRRPKRLGARAAIAITVGVVAILTITSAIFWPGGLIHHWPPQPKATPDTIPTVPPTTLPVIPTTAPTGTTVKGASTVPASTLPGAPTTPAPATTTPTTKG